MTGGDAVCQRPSEASCEGSCGEENSTAKAEFSARIEETEKIRKARTVASFRHGQKPAAYHYTGPVESGGLECRGKAPNSNTAESPDMWREYLPHESEPFEEDIRDIEDRQ